LLKLDQYRQIAAFIDDEQRRMREQLETLLRGSRQLALPRGS